VQGGRGVTPRFITLAGATMEVVESCVYTWLFDRDRHRFRRVPRGRRIDLDNPVSEWEHYERLELDAHGSTFMVVLNADGTRLLSAGWHGEHCPCMTLAGAPAREVATP